MSELNNLRTCNTLNTEFGTNVKRFVAIDVDNFKAYNELFGYEEATSILNELAVYLINLSNKKRKSTAKGLLPSAL